MTVDVSSRPNYGTAGAARHASRQPGTGGNQTAGTASSSTPPADDFRQATGSPTIDAGTGTPDGERRDFEGGPRCARSPSVDIGGDEARADRPGVADEPRLRHGRLRADRSDQDFTFTNLGTDLLTDRDAEHHRVQQPPVPPPVVLLGGWPRASCSFPVLFGPGIPGPAPVTLRVVTNAGAVLVPLTGVGVASPPVITATIDPPTPSTGWHRGDVTVTGPSPISKAPSRRRPAATRRPSPPTARRR